MTWCGYRQAGRLYLSSEPVAVRVPAGGFSRCRVCVAPVSLSPIAPNIAAATAWKATIRILKAASTSVHMFRMT